MTSCVQKRNTELLAKLKKAVLEDDETAAYTYYMELLKTNPSALEEFKNFCDELNKIKITIGKEA